MGLRDALKRAFAAPGKARPGGWSETRSQFEQDVISLDSSERLRCRKALKALNAFLEQMILADPPNPGAKRLRHQFSPTGVAETRGWAVGKGFGQGEVYFPQFIWLTTDGQLWWGLDQKWLGDSTPGAWYGVDDDDFRLGCHHDSSSAEYQAIGSIPDMVESLTASYFG